MKKKDSEQSDDQQLYWLCTFCTYKNYPKINSCQMCSSERPKESYPPKMDEQKKEQKGSYDFQCHKCAFGLKILVEKCPKCGEILIPLSDQEEQISKPKIKKQSKMIKCPHCSQLNDEANAECVFCEQSMTQKKLLPQIRSAVRPPKKYARPKKALLRHPGYTTCPHCNLVIVAQSLPDHEFCCSKIPKAALKQKFALVPKNWCPFCYQKIESSTFSTHNQKCSSRKQFFSRDTQTYKNCSKLQIQTMLYMHEVSELKHWASQSGLLAKIAPLKYTAKDLQNLHHYIVNYAPIIIHMHANSHMQFFVKDTHYRNQFQTRKSSGSLSESSRTQWQDRMFDHKHHHATPFQRVKYGTINFTNDPKGVRACQGYGQSYFLLKPHVRNRCTVTDMDSSSPSATIATFQFCFHLLNKLSVPELKAAFQASKAAQVQSNCIGAYKQIQIHGPVAFKQDIERVYINRSELTDPSIESMVKQFCKNNSLEYQVFGVAPVPPPVRTGVPMSPFLGHVFVPSPIATQVQKIPTRIVGSSFADHSFDPLVAFGPIAPVLPFGGGSAYSYSMKKVPKVKPYKKQKGKDYI